MFLLLATLCYTFGPLVKKAPKQAAAAAVVDSGGVFIFLTCMGNPGSWEVKSWNGKNVGLLRLVKVFFATKHVFFSCICYWIIFGEIELSWMGLYDTWIILQMDEVRKMIIYIYILICYFEMIMYIGEGHPRRISSKDTLCFIGRSTGLAFVVKYAEVPSTSSLRCCLTATITSRRGWWGP